MISDGDMQDAIDERALRDPTVRELDKLLKAKGFTLHAGILLDGWLEQLESTQRAVRRGPTNRTGDPALKKLRGAPR